jgi:hypothetical protein
MHSFSIEVLFNQSTVTEYLGLGIFFLLQIVVQEDPHTDTFVYVCSGCISQSVSFRKLRYIIKEIYAYC